ncbi:MAG: extracellular solute-binding protein [Paracoccaceae bacterium]|jgi:spermidine/putrescine transport system substrate-binding protein|nr:MAG: ABC transporter substrate-binding protein [Rhodobacter sp. BACL10 MAG-121220-bin24]MDO7654438.1 extracellular solute-binding protein [Paracoccaceae bacterium]MDP5357024.1 extracellular solute-binding protein [Paracoccaceae bacterium]MDP5368492.1 extracellular solute-binding protein [Paracoccaceae bacterium]
MITKNKLNRRSFLKTSAIGVGSMAAPSIISFKALASSGELNLMNWSDEFMGDVIPDFEKATGIVVNQTPFSQNEEQINKLQATGGEGFDLISPTVNRAPQYRDLDVIAPYDMGRLKNVGNLIGSMVKASEDLWTWGGGLNHLPHCWGSEAISYRTDLYKGDPSQISYGSMWDEGVKGHVQGRPHSFLLSIGLWWDASGKMASNRMLDGYKDEDSFKKVWDPILAFAIENKAFVKQFWDSADSTKSGLMENDVHIGLTWDGPALSLKKDGKPVNYVAPIEGAITWIDGLSLMKSAQNVDAAYEFLNYLHTPEVSAKFSEAAGYNPVVVGADQFTSDVFKKNFQEAFSGDALSKLWAWPPEPTWYAEIRSQYADKFKAA